MTATATKLEAIIFDFDGVILESLDAKTEAFRELFAGHADHVDRIVRLHVENLGVSRYEKFKTIYREYLQEPLDDAEMARLDADFSALVFDRVATCEFVAGAPAFLERVSRDHRLHVASATPEEELRRLVEVRGLTPLFTSVRGSPRTKEQAVGDILREEGIEASQAVFIGDAISDFHGASAHAVPFIGRVPDGEPNPFEDLDLQTIRDLADLESRWDEVLGGVGLRR